jgi:hypothetical protein
LLGRNDPEARAELGRLVDAAPGVYAGMVQVARIYLEGWINQGPEDPAEGQEGYIQ